MATARKLARLEALERKSGAGKPLLVVSQDLQDRDLYHSAPRGSHGGAADQTYRKSEFAALTERHTLIIVEYREGIAA